jgi:glycerol-1-phosphate dehydrogenase [NAD(P)+]
MHHLMEGRKDAWHGAKVGVATVEVARRYAAIRALSRRDLLDRLEAAALPDREADLAAIRDGYGPLADEVAGDHAAFLSMTPQAFEAIKRRVAERWDDVLRIAARVPPPETVAAYLARVGGPSTPAGLGLHADEVAPAFHYGHFLRNRFTVMKLSRLLGLPLA